MHACKGRHSQLCLSSACASNGALDCVSSMSTSTTEKAQVTFMTKFLAMFPEEVCWSSLKQDGFEPSFYSLFGQKAKEKFVTWLKAICSGLLYLYCSTTWCAPCPLFLFVHGAITCHWRRCCCEEHLKKQRPQGKEDLCLVGSQHSSLYNIQQNSVCFFVCSFESIAKFSLDLLCTLNVLLEIISFLSPIKFANQCVVGPCKQRQKYKFTDFWCEITALLHFGPLLLQNTNPKQQITPNSARNYINQCRKKQHLRLNNQYYHRN